MRLIVSCLLCRQQEHAGLNSTESMTRALISDDNIARQSALGPVQLGYVHLQPLKGSIASSIALEPSSARRIPKRLYDNDALALYPLESKFTCLYTISFSKIDLFFCFVQFENFY